MRREGPVATEVCPWISGWVVIVCGVSMSLCVGVGGMVGWCKLPMCASNPSLVSCRDLPHLPARLGLEMKSR